MLESPIYDVFTKWLPGLPPPGLTLAANSCRQPARPQLLLQIQKQPPPPAPHTALTRDHSRIESKLFVIRQNGNGSYRRRVIPVSPCHLASGHPISCDLFIWGSLEDDVFIQDWHWTRLAHLGLDRKQVPKSSQQLDTVKEFSNAGYAK